MLGPEYEPLVETVRCYRPGMTRAGLAVLISVVVALAMTYGAAGAASGRQATLRVTSLQPLALAGSQFAPRERVEVRVSTDSGAARRTVRAGRRGMFAVQFATVTVDRCNGGMSAVARGGRGSFAAAKVLPQPLCPPAGGPPG